MTKMFLIIILLLISSIDANFQCDFESSCNDFIIDDNWGFTDGYHPVPIDHDHTLNTSTGHYIFYQPSIDPQFKSSEIKTKDWLQPLTDRTRCFTMWYFTTDINLSFNIQLIQGDDEQLSRIIDQISNNNQSKIDWSQVKVVLPTERIKVSIRINRTNERIAFDDLLIDYCDNPRPPMPKVLFSCDFESSCSDNFLSLPAYPYQWMVIQAGQRPIPADNPPTYDYTYGNQSGHYARVKYWGHIFNGRTGYFATQQAFNIQENQSYCLNFEYFNYGLFNTTKLKVYTSMWDSPNAVEMIWPLGNASQYQYSFDRWTWAIINLPIGHYYILFRIETGEGLPFNNFVLDNIEIISCDYPPSELSPIETSFLSFSCNFDDMSQCGIRNDDGSSFSPSYHFSVYTGDNVLKSDLGPRRDHTNNSTVGGFLYWNQQLPFVPRATGFIDLGKPIEQNSGMCIQFAYYVKSLMINKNGTTLSLFALDNPTQWLWRRSLDDSQGWQIVTIILSNSVRRGKFYFIVNQQVNTDISVAFDDITAQQCATLPFISTTTTTTTISSTAWSSSSTSTTIVSTESQTKSTTITTTLTATTKSIPTSATNTPTSSTSQPNSAQRQYISINIWSQLIIVLCLYIFC